MMQPLCMFLKIKRPKRAFLRNQNVPMRPPLKKDLSNLSFYLIVFYVFVCFRHQRDNTVQTLHNG